MHSHADRDGLPGVLHEANARDALTSVSSFVLNDRLCFFSAPFMGTCFSCCSCNIRMNLSFRVFVLASCGRYWHAPL